MTDCTQTHVALGTEILPCRTKIWAAGVRASPVAEWLDCKADSADRAIVESDLTAPDQPSVFVIGDTAAVTSDGSPVPGIAPAAKQQGAYVAKVILARLRGAAPPPSFRYRHQGDFATVGKRAAIVRFGRIEMTGALAWWIWGLAHIYYLIGARSRATVAINWLWTYLRGQTSARLIAGALQPITAAPEANNSSGISADVREATAQIQSELEHPAP